MNILIVCAFFGKGDNANGICAKNITESFVSKGHKVWVISSSLGKLPPEEGKNTNVIYIPVERSVSLMYHQSGKSSLWFKILLICNRLFRLIALMPFYPNSSPFRSRKVFTKAKDLVENEKIDAVLCTYKPFESIYSACKLKKKYGNSIKVFSYHMDLLSSIASNESGLSVKFKERRLARVCKHENSVVDKIFLPIGGSEVNMTNVVHVGFPVYIKPKLMESDFHPVPNVINMTYIGSLDKRNRNLDIAVNIISLLAACLKRKVNLNIWGRICDLQTMETISSCPFIIYRGVIENQKTYDILMKSDILLNISNAQYFSFIPSKIFQLFASGKKILNIVQNPKDASLVFFEQYPGSFNIKSYLDIKNQVSDISSKISDDFFISEEDVSFLLEQYSPEFFYSAFINEVNSSIS